MAIFQQPANASRNIGVMEHWNSELRKVKIEYPCIPTFHHSMVKKTMNFVTRRLFLKFLLGLPLLSSFPLRPQEAWADLASHPKKRADSIGEFFKGEELHYDIGLWQFKKVATGKISFEEMGKKGRYLATLQGESLGFLGFVSRYRVDTYRSIMEEIDGGRRLRSISFEEDVKIGSKLRRRTSLLRLSKAKVDKRKAKKGWDQGEEREGRFLRE